MRMPDSPIESDMFAPCGMNCLVCYKHCDHKKPCEGCVKGDRNKPEHCRGCRIKACAQAKGHSHCHECGEFPCKWLNSLDRSYRVRYGASLVENSRTVCRLGLSAFMKQQKKAFTCPACGGIISLHDGECSECRRKAKE